MGDGGQRARALNDAFGTGVGAAIMLRKAI